MSLRVLFKRINNRQFEAVSAASDAHNFDCVFKLDYKWFCVPDTTIIIDDNNRAQYCIVFVRKIEALVSENGYVNLGTLIAHYKEYYPNHADFT